MGDTTIGWTDKTSNPWIGCQQVTEEECGDCYAKRWAGRHQLDAWGSLYASHRHLTKTSNDPRKKKPGNRLPFALQWSLITRKDPCS